MRWPEGRDEVHRWRTSCAGCPGGDRSWTITLATRGSLPIGSAGWAGLLAVAVRPYRRRRPCGAAGAAIGGLHRDLPGRRTAHNPDLMVANSSYVRKRIRRIYGRDAIVIFPPVAVSEFPMARHKDDYYVTASFLAPYKRTDLVIAAFNEMPSKRLVVVGEGQQSKKLRALAGPNVTFTGFLSESEYVKTVAEAQALVFAGCEDFGIALAEAQSAGTPVIAFHRGGASDIVKPAGGRISRPASFSANRASEP